MLAARLSENPKIKVLLLEAGGTPPVVSSVPAFGSFLQKSPFDWQFETVSQKNACLAMEDKVGSNLEFVVLQVMI